MFAPQTPCYSSALMSLDPKGSGQGLGSGRRRYRVRVGLRQTVPLILAASVIAALIAGCGGSSKSSSTSTTASTAAHGKTKTKTTTTSAKPLQQLRVNAKGAQPGSAVKVNPGQVVAIVVHVPATDTGKKVNIAVDQTTPTTFTVTSAVLGTSLK